MAFTRPTLKTIVDRIKADFKAGLGLQTILRRSFLDVFAKAFGAASHSLHGHIDYAINKKFFPDTGDEATVIKWGTLYNLPRNEATFAQLTIEFAGTTGGTVVAGSILKRADGVQYELDADVTVAAASTAQGTMTAVEAGSNGNIDDGSTVSLQSPVAGVESEAEVISTVIEADDLEPIEDYRVRVLERMQKPPSGGTVADFIAFAKTVTGVTRVWVLPDHLGEGTVGLTFVQDNDNPIIPSPAEVDEVQEAVTELMPVNVDLTVFAPTTTSINPVIKLKPNTVAVQNAVIAELNDMLAREAQVRDASNPDQVGLGVQFTGVIPLSKINEAISIAADENDHVLVSPTADVQPQTGGLVVLGTPTFQTLT